MTSITFLAIFPNNNYVFCYFPRKRALDMPLLTFFLEFSKTFYKYSSYFKRVYTSNVSWISIPCNFDCPNINVDENLNLEKLVSDWNFKGPRNWIEVNLWWFSVPSKSSKTPLVNRPESKYNLEFEYFA